MGFHRRFQKSTKESEPFPDLVIKRRRGWRRRRRCEIDGEAITCGGRLMNTWAKKR